MRNFWYIRVLIVFIFLLLKGNSLYADKVNISFTPSNARVMAEWEEAQALVIAWTNYPQILKQIVQAAIKECKVLILTTQPQVVQAELLDTGISLDSIVFINQNFNSIWIRDYGPWTIYNNEVGALNFVDFIYNRPNRQDDDRSAVAIANYFNRPIYQLNIPPINWTHTGGNFLVDGLGTAFSSVLVLNENLAKTETEINWMAKQFMGIQNYVKLARLPFDFIHHLDMHMRLLDEETLLIGQYPEGVADGPQIEANVDFIKRNLKTPFGNPYKIVRIPMPMDQAGLFPDEGGAYRTYTNSLILNRSILLPLYEERFDTTAIRIYQEHFPGYRIVGIDCDDIVPAYGALHCITKLVGVANPFLIAPSRLQDTYFQEEGFPVQAKIKHRDGIMGATIYYRQAQSATFKTLPLVQNEDNGDFWEAVLPPQPTQSTIQYYIEAVSFSGKKQRRPLVAPGGYFQFHIKANQLAPLANFVFNTKPTCSGQTVQFRDYSTGCITEWEWSFPGGAPSTSKEKNPSIYYPQPGIYDASLIVMNEFGQDTLTLTTIIKIDDGVLIEQEDFETPNLQWQIDDVEKDEVTWQISTPSSCHRQSILLDNFSFDTRDTRDVLRARLDLSDRATATLFFDVAYAPLPIDQNRFDALRVHLIDCAGEKETPYNQFGLNLATAPTQATPFEPRTCIDWRRDSVDLSNYLGSTLIIEFENLGGHGNNLYLDNIELQSTPITSVDNPNLQELSIDIFPMPNNDFFTIDIKGKKVGKIHYQLFNTFGQGLKKGNWDKLTEENRYYLSVKELPSGIYYLHLEFLKRTLTKKVVIQK